MKIDFTKEQYERLVELVHLGEWMANSTQTEELNKDYEAIIQYIFSFAKDFGHKGIEYDQELDIYDLKNDYEDEIHEIIDEYDEYTFWDELQTRLVDRDFYNEHGLVKKLTDKHIQRKYEIELMYNREFEKNGLKNLVLLKVTK